ncbi:hypothetical protein DFJ58DRAFT_876980 [Suillus subalutaceus]|uniref:uncharacterized protein n=1 Tax=Suillus subalutaceus TaxID=48586 RepID=UPI001B867806|nr:uncharacterized protein DFJ58DRAFT_876980 [Suillus subalutaceus]KAG1858013.1 hypothetical protein DFJ58DRAFT_876980 [Suillus subalutaceus]
MPWKRISSRWVKMSVEVAIEKYNDGYLNDWSGREQRRTLQRMSEMFYRHHNGHVLPPSTCSLFIFYSYPIGITSVLQHTNAQVKTTGIRPCDVRSMWGSCLCKEQEQLEDEEFTDIVRKAKKKELRRQRRKVRNNLLCFEDAQSSATASATAIWATESDMVPDNQGSSPQRYPPMDHDTTLPDFYEPDPGPNKPNPGPNKPNPGPNEPNPGPNELTHKLDDIQVGYHPHSQLPSTDQTNHLLDLVHQSASSKDTFTLQNHDEVRSLWDLSSQHYTRRRMNSTCTTALSGIGRLTCYGERFVRFIDEPWTANAFWNAQSHLPPDAKLLAFILYADKNKLSSFGSQKGYPIIACIANLPVHIHNSNTAIGGGRVVGWLPIVGASGRFRTHEEEELLASVAKHSNTGYWFECGDGIQHHLWPLVLILSANYEEQCVMTLIRGLTGKFLCPVCLVPQDQQSDLRTHKLRTSRQSEAILHTARSMSSEKEKEDRLKAFSLRNVQNVFSRIIHMDVHHALPFNRLHTNKEGLWGDHLWKEVKFWIADLGQEATVKLDQNFDALPQWPDLTHFSSVIAVDFTDGTVLGDLSKDILSSSHCKLGYLLLRCLHYYIEFDIYALFEVHTEDMIAAGRLEYIAESQPETLKNWNFPKKHLISHVFDNISAKGVTRNYSTKPNEKMHGSFRKIYLQHTNFKNIASQILHYDEWLLTSTSMCTELDELDKYNQRDSRDPETNEALDDAGNPESTTVHAHLGSRQGNHSFSDIMHSHGTDRAFTDFRMKLNGFLNIFLPQNGIPLPDGRRIHLRVDDTVTEFWFLRIHYESIVNWCLH